MIARLVLVALLGFGGITTAKPVAAQQTVDIKEWRVPWENSRPRDPAVAPDGRVWFVGQRSDYIGVLDPTTGEFDKIDLDEGTGPHNQIVGDDGTIWYAGNLQRHIGRIDPETHAIHKIMMPDPAARDPHTLVFDGKGHIWFTVQGGNIVGRLTMADESVDLIKVPTAGARPYGILLDDAAHPWIALFGTNKLATVDPETLELTEIELPRKDARPRRIGRTSDGRLWYGDYRGGMLGSYDPESGEIQEWALPSGEDSRPYALCADENDNIWVFETGVDPNRLVGFDPASESFFSGTDIPSGGGTVRNVYYDADAGAIWFGTDVNTIGRAIVH